MILSATYKGWHIFLNNHAHKAYENRNMISAQEKFHISMAPQVPVVVARYGGEAALMGKVAAAVQAHQSDADALLAAHLFAAILDRLALYGGTLQVGALGLGNFLPSASSSARHVMHYLLACNLQPLAKLGSGPDLTARPCSDQ